MIDNIPEDVYGIIYLVVNKINSKIYIGQKKITTKTSQIEWKNYLGSGLIIKQAIKKYGRSWFKKEILGYCYSQEELNKAEIECIAFYNSINPSIGYNISIGGQGSNQTNGMKNKKHTEESKQKISISLKNSEKLKETFLSIEYRNNKSISLKNSDKFKQYLKNRVYTEHQRSQMKLKNSGNNNIMYGTSVYQIWVEKYGEEVAKQKQQLSTQKRLNTIKSKQYLKAS